MKKILLIFLLGLSTFVFGQSDVIEIEYEVKLTDPITGLEIDNPNLKPDWHFNVKFDSAHIKVWRKFSDDYYETRIINKGNKEVFVLTCESKSNYAFYVSTAEMLNMDMSSNYEDTTINITGEHKSILGYDCYKVEMDFGGQANAVLWVADTFTTGIIIPETPLSMAAIALECRFESPSGISEFKATRITHKSEIINNTSIPDKYLLMVPFYIFELNDLVTDEITEYDFVQYPNYPNGKTKLHSEIKAQCDMSKSKGADMMDLKMAFISFTVKKDGRLENIHVDGLINENEKQKIGNFLSESTFNPGIVKGEKVNSFVQFSISLLE